MANPDLSGELRKAELAEIIRLFCSPDPNTVEEGPPPLNELAPSLAEALTARLYAHVEAAIRPRAVILEDLMPFLGLLRLTFSAGYKLGIFDGNHGGQMQE